MPRQHRREGQGNHAGNQHGAGQREREFGKQRADQPAHEADGRVDGDQRGGHRDHRRSHLARPVQRRLEARLALLDMPVHVFDDDDGIVDHQPDRQHHGQQRQQVEGKPQQQHDQRAADQRQRHGHRGHHGGTQRTQRQENHHQHDQHRLQQRLDDLVDRAVDEFRSVVGKLHVQTGRQLLANIGQLFAHQGGHIQRVGARRQLDRNIGRRLTLVVVGLRVGLRTQLGARDIAQADDAAVDLLDHQLLECFRAGHVGGRFEIDAHHLVARAPDARQEVVLQQDIDQFAGGHVDGRQPRRINPDPLGEPAPQELGLADPGNRLQTRLDFAKQIIGDAGCRHGLAEKRDVHQGGRFAGRRGDDRVAHRIGQYVALAGDLGLNLGKRVVGVVVELHARLDGRLAQRAGRGQEVDALGFGNRLLQRRGHETLDQLGIGAGIGRRNRHRGAFEFGKLPNLELHGRARAHQQNQQADHGRQHRAPNEDIGKAHQPCPGSFSDRVRATISTG